MSPTGNWMFRLRMGGIAPNAKSESILIDTDGLFGNTGSFADPNYTLDNPGFEIEIVLATLPLKISPLDWIPNPKVKSLGVAIPRESPLNINPVPLTRVPPMPEINTFAVLPDPE